jgi:hypothetical protein
MSQMDIYIEAVKRVAKGERPRVDYRQEFAWLPRFTADEQWVWLKHVWHMTVDGKHAGFSLNILPIGWHR